MLYGALFYLAICCKFQSWEELCSWIT